MIAIMFAIAASAYGFQEFAQRINGVLANGVMDMFAALLRDDYARKPHYTQMLRNNALRDSE